MVPDLHDFEPLLTGLSAIPLPETSVMSSALLHKRKEQIARNIRDFIVLHFMEEELEALRHVEPTLPQEATLFTNVEEHNTINFEMLWNFAPDTSFRLLHSKNDTQIHAYRELEIIKEFESGQIVMRMERQADSLEVTRYLTLIPKTGLENDSKFEIRFDSVGVRDQKLYGKNTDVTLQQVKETFGEFDYQRFVDDPTYAKAVYMGYRGQLFGTSINRT